MVILRILIFLILADSSNGTQIWSLDIKHAMIAMIPIYPLVHEISTLAVIIFYLWLGLLYCFH
jgi:hypothetical protein